MTLIGLRSLHPNFRSICSIVQVESVREFKDGSRSSEKTARYYISSLSQTAQRGLSISRKHCVKAIIKCPLSAIIKCPLF